MGVIRQWGGIVAASLAAALIVPSAAAAARHHRHGFHVSAGFFKAIAESGSIQVSFTSDPASCATVGRCGIGGTETFTLARSAADDGAIIVAFKVPGHPWFTTGQILVTGNSSATVTGPAGGPQCSDSLAGSNVALGLKSLPRQQAAVVLAPVATHDRALQQLLVFGGVDPFDMRCAGPRLLDVLRPAMTPIGSIPVSSFSHRLLSLDLKGTKTFNSGGFGGTVALDFHLTLKRAKSHRSGKPKGGGFFG